MLELKIGDKVISQSKPTYFIADIAANHDGDLSRAVDLIYIAAEAGADAAKFQHFRAQKIVSKEGFEAMQDQVSHQSTWKKSVYEVYQAASVDWEWTEKLKETCDKAGITFFSSPYDIEAIDFLDRYMPAYKIGSGDITWTEALEHIAHKGKPVLLATGASDLGEIQRAVSSILAINKQLLLMQCNTNYTASRENFKYIQLNVLKTFAAMYPELLLGLSDHTPGHATVLGAVALGARAIEKHFTDDNHREGPDHKFAMNPTSWREMVDRTRELEYALGNGNKVVEDNEKETVVVQRRSIRAARDLTVGEKITREDIEPLRPAPRDGIFPYDIPRVVGKKATRQILKGEHLRWTDLG